MSALLDTDFLRIWHIVGDKNNAQIIPVNKSTGISNRKYRLIVIILMSLCACEEKL
jgi:hypothetical protein